MIDQEYKIISDKIICDDNNQERKSWTCLSQSCSRSRIVFLCKLLVILLIIIGSFWKIHLSQKFEESTVSMGILCSAGGYILPSPRLRAFCFPQKIRKIAFFTIGTSVRDGKVTTYVQLAQNWILLSKLWPNSLFYFYSQPLWIYRFVEKQRFKKLVNFWRFLWRNLQIKGVCCYCYC